MTAVGYELSHLDRLEAESVHIFREVAATIEQPALLFSGGKDSVVMLHLAVKAFWPAPIPFPVMHVDTGENFDEVLEFRDRTVEKYGLRLIVASVQDDIDAGRSVEDSGPRATRNRLQTVTLLRGINENRFGAVFGGARRDEEKARAKERVFSFRDEFGQWDPRNQRPELWNLYNGRHRKGENIRVFPLSNWTELDIWSYIEAEQHRAARALLRAPARGRRARRHAAGRQPLHRPRAGRDARSRPPCASAPSATPPAPAASSRPPPPPTDVVAEVAAARLTERGATRADDRISEAGMEDRKKEGYF